MGAAVSLSGWLLREGLVHAHLSALILFQGTAMGTVGTSRGAEPEAAAGHRLIGRASFTRWMMLLHNFQVRMELAWIPAIQTTGSRRRKPVAGLCLSSCCLFCLGVCSFRIFIGRQLFSSH